MKQRKMKPYKRKQSVRVRKGETLAETLIALLIGVLALLVLPMSIVTSAKINHRIRTDEKIRTVEKRDSTASPVDGAEVWMKNAEESETTAVGSVRILKDSAGYVYYDYEPESTPPVSGGAEP